MMRPPFKKSETKFIPYNESYRETTPQRYRGCDSNVEKV